VVIADTRRPLVLDVRPLGRRPGTMWEGSLTAAAPEQLGRDLESVPAGAELELDLRLESVLDGVLVTADVTAPLGGECARCLEPVHDTITVSFTELWSYPEQADRYARTAGESLGDDEVYLLDGDRLDLEQAVRDAIVLALPAQPLCRDDCAGLCVTCGGRLDDLEPNHSHAQADSRWAALVDLQDGLT
jgi:uncharacterized protein